MLISFQSHIENRFPELLRRPFLLACSGGIDSMVLVDLCARSRLNFAMAHCNFQLRGNESDLDQKFVENQAHQKGIKIFTNRFNTDKYADKNKVSIQMAARELRYAWFDKLMLENDIPFLVTAHHADDNLETFIINLSRGTGTSGLTGIPEKTDTIMRPLLPFSRAQIEVYAKDRDIEWREDSSNAGTKYLRNSIRHRIVPILKELNPNFLDNFQRTQHFLSQTADIADTHINRIRASLFQREGEVIIVPIAKIADLKPLRGYLYGLFGDYGFTEWNDVENLLQATSGKEVRSKTHRLIKDRDNLLLTEIPLISADKSKSNKYHIEKGLRCIEHPFKMDISEVSAIDKTGLNILYVSKKALKYPLTLRKWGKGDYFYPFGMQGKKKLSKYFKDEKVDVLAKDEQWLLCSGEEIVWVVGRRADERFKVVKTTEQILKFELKS